MIILSNFLIIYAIIVVSCTGKEPTTCGDKQCFNGICEEGSICKCNNCFTGSTCEEIKNQRPKFEQSTYHVQLMHNSIENNTLVMSTIKAQDPDQCTTIRGDIKCPCATVHFSLLNDNSDALNYFQIEGSTGNLRTIREINSEIAQLLMQSNQVMVLTAKVSNEAPFDNDYDTATIEIHFNDIDHSNQADSNLYRYKREAAPSKPMFTLTQIYPTVNISKINFGQKLRFELVITLPTTQGTISMEIFAPESANKPTMNLCDIKVVSIGSDITPQTIPEPLKEGKAGAKWPYTRVVYTMTNFKNSQSNPVDVSTIQIKFQFDAITLFEPETINAATYYVSAGAEYLNGAEIWVGQAAYMTELTYSTSQPTITLTGDTVLYPSYTAVFDLILVSDGQYIGLEMELYAPLNDTTVLSICVVYTYSVGEAYSCIPTDMFQHTLSSVTINNKKYYNKATLALKYATNQLFVEGASNPSKSTIKMKMFLRTNPSAWIGEWYYVGASVSHIHNQIWTGKVPLQIKAKVPLASYTSQITTSFDYENAQSTAAIAEISSAIVKIVVPDNSILDYTFEVYTKDDKTEICNIGLLTAGRNIPCIDQIEPKTNFTLNDAKTINKFFAVYEAIRHSPVFSNTSDSEMTFKIDFRVVNSSINSPGHKATIGFILHWNGGKSPEFTKVYDLTAFISYTPLTIAELPNYTFDINPNTNIFIEMPYQIQFSMQLKPGVKYSSSSLEFFLENSTSGNRMKFCGYDIVYIGKNLMCFSKDLVLSKVEKINRAGMNETYDKVKFNLNSPCTKGVKGTAPTILDTIKITLDFVLLPHASNTAGATFFINAGLIISESFIWVGSKQMTIIAPPGLTAATGDNLPYIYSNRIDDTSNVFYRGDVAIIQYLVKINFNFAYTLNLKISSDIATTDEFNVCYIRIVKKTDEISCLDSTTNFVPWNEYSKMSKEASFNIKYARNYGNTTIQRNPSYDSNSILFEVGVKFGFTVTANAQVIALLTFNLAATINNVVSLVYNSLPTRFNGSQNDPGFNFYLYPLFNDTSHNVTRIAYGESMRAVVSVQLLPTSLQSLKIVFSTKPSSLNQMDINSVNILKVGANIPCLKPGMLKFATEKRPGALSIDSANLDLGTICQRISNDTTSTDVENNKLYVEAVFTVWRYPKSDPLPTSLEINVIGLLNNDRVYVTQIVFDTSEDNSLVPDNSLSFIQPAVTVSVNGATTVEIGSIFQLNVTLEIPPYTQCKNGRVLLSTPKADDSFPLTLQYYTNEMPLESATIAGVNIPVNPAHKIKLQGISTDNTSQIDQVIINLGPTQNPSINYRFTKMNFTAGSPDNQLSFLLPLQLSDNKLSINNYVLTATVIFEMGSNLSANKTFSITVSRPATGLTLELETITQLISTDLVYAADTNMKIGASVKVKNGSKLECRNMLIILSIPSFMKLKSVESNYSSKGYPVEQSVLTTGSIQFKVPFFFYNEQLQVNATIALQTNTELSGKRQTVKSTFPVVYTCRKVNVAEWINKVDDITPTIQGNTITVVGCNNDLQVTSTTVLKDCAIRALFSPYVGYEPIKVRSNSGAAWKPATRGGVYSRLRYIDLVFGISKKITEILLKSTDTNKPTVIDIYGTMDGRSFGFYRSLAVRFTGDTATVSLSQPYFIYRGIRIALSKLTNDDQETQINIDLKGCDAPFTDSTSFDPCTISSRRGPPYTQATTTDYYIRGFLYSTTELFVCDYVPRLSSDSSHQSTAQHTIYPRCLRAKNAAPTVWIDMGPFVGRVIGYNITTKHIYALSASDLNSYLISEDDGLTWLSMNQVAWQLIKAMETITLAISIPWTVTAGTFESNINGTACTLYAAGTWKFCYDGVYIGTTRHLAWNNCCAP